MSDEPNVNDKQFCFCPAPVKQFGKTRAAVLNATKWQPGETIRIKFVEGDETLKSRVTTVAREWLGTDKANVVFQFVTNGDAEIRSAFMQGKGSWSYLGTDCRQIAQSQPTMNYGWLTPASTDDELRRVVLHEFGHALGLVHEHQNPKDPIQWNEDAVIADLSGPPNNWSAETIHNNIFKQYNMQDLTATNLDPGSIMMYPIPKAWTKNGFSSGLNAKLSGLDKQLIHIAYPS